MDHEVELETTINGAPVIRRVKARMHLADFLREVLELTGTHLGCEHGVCGACTVLIDGRTARGCLVLAAQVSGKEVQTIEYMSDSGDLSALQQAFRRHNAAQCGFCTPGMLLTAHEFLSGTHSADRQEIRDFISGNFCRCTGYQSIVDAIADVARVTSAKNGR